MGSGLILTINSGSSSIKFSLYGMEAGERPVLAGMLDSIGLPEGSFTVRYPDGRTASQTYSFPGHDAAFKTLFRFLKENSFSIKAVGHRVVHGGMDYGSPSLIDEALLKRLKELVPFAPEHLPHEIKGIEAVSENYPGVSQSACFDTAFHRSMPKLAQMYALPATLREEGIIKYGFHGLSYEYIVSELGTEAKGRVIMAHLGNGASMAAVRDLRPVDTTMGFTPVSGLVMSTRTGDLDPGAVIYLLRNKSMTPEEVNVLINKRSGLLGVSGTSPDMRDLLLREREDERAAEAIGLFCYQARKYTGAFAAALGGLDTFVFTGGMGENSPEIRERILSGLEFLGIRIDREKNLAGSPVISPDGPGVRVRVIKTNEELMIARQTAALL